MKFIFLILSILLLFFGKNNYAQTNIFNGILLSKTDSTPIENAHIINLRTRKGVVSNAIGNFKIEAQKKDTLLISMLGFKNKRLTNLNLDKIIYLQKESYMLSTFNVLPYKNFKEFKDAFLKLKIKESKIKINPSIYLSKEELIRYDGAVGIGGAISALLGHFNKYVQDKKHFEELIKTDKYKAKINKKFNKQLIARITNITDSSIIKDFKTYCDFDNHFIEIASDYELSKQIIDCYKEYKNLALTEK